VEPVRVLVVDDDPAFLDMMVGHLRKKDFIVEDAEDGREALEILRSCGPFSVIVTDLMMPGLSGLELLRSARKLDPMLEVIVITAADSVDMAVSALREDGAYDYLTKPLGMIGELSVAVERAAHHRQISLERQAMRGSLANGARRLKEILGSTGLAIMAGNERDELVVISPAAAGLLGMDMEDTRRSKGKISQPLRLLLEGWRSLGGNQVSWVEAVLPNGESKLVRIAPMSLADSPGWVMLFQDITYVKRLERFIVDSYARVVTLIKKPMDMASVVIDDLDRRLRTGEGDPIAEVGHLKQLFKEAHEASQDLSTLNSNGSDSGLNMEKILLNGFLRKIRSKYVQESKNSDGEGYQWDLGGEIPPIEADQTLLYKFIHHMLQYAELRSQRREDILIKTWSAGDRVWLSVSNRGLEAHEGNQSTSEFQGYDPWWDSFNKGQMELAAAKSKAEQMGHQVWLYQTENGVLAVAVCFLTGEKHS
jgi:CheY-like chemotaxis protein